MESRTSRGPAAASAPREPRTNREYRVLLATCNHLLQVGFQVFWPLFAGLHLSCPTFRHSLLVASSEAKKRSTGKNSQIYAGNQRISVEMRGQPPSRGDVHRPRFGSFGEPWEAPSQPGCSPDQDSLVSSSKMPACTRVSEGGTRPRKVALESLKVL